MLDSARLEELLIASGKVEANRFEEVRKCTLDGKISLDKALVLLNIADYRELGRCFSEMYGLPYLPLLSEPPSDQARRLLSAECATAWKVFPAKYDSEENLLTVAVHDPDQIPRLESIHRFFMRSHTMAFTIASQAEIEEALEVHFTSRRSNESGVSEFSQKDKAQQKRKLSFPARDRASSGLPTEGEKSETEAQSGFPYGEMGRALISLAALTARTHVEKDSARLQDIRACVRYCQLLSSRLNLSPVQTDGVVLAAWISAFEDKPEIPEELATPYRLGEILSPEETLPERQRVEARILSLVGCYQDLRKSDPSSCRDVNLTRRCLHELWSSSPEVQNMLETFLQVLMDEEFLSKLDRASGRILIVDPAEAATSSFAPPLAGDGYEVEVAPNAEAADEIMLKFLPNLIISEMDLPRGNGVRFCRKVKRAARTAHVPFIMLMAQGNGKQAAECLRAGADDFMTKPVDLELLFLKIQRLLAVPADEAGKAGVSGSLHDMSFTDMIQILCAGGRSMEITLARGEEKGRVFVQNGEIIHACVGDATGQDAFYELMRWREGEFTTRECSVFPARTIQSSAMSLLMEGARLADENGAGALPA